MSLCRTCEYALYDGMCMAHGKFTLLDAPACDDYKMHLDVEVSKLNAENAKLREQIHWLKQGDILHVLTDQEYIDQCERERLMQVSIDALDKENAKLRELVADVHDALRADKTGMFHKLILASMEDDMRELGVEVSE